MVNVAANLGKPHTNTEYTTVAETLSLSLNRGVTLWLVTVTQDWWVTARVNRGVRFGVFETLVTLGLLTQG